MSRVFIKKAVPVLLVISMVILVFAGCSKKDNINDASDTRSGAKTATAAITTAKGASLSSTALKNSTGSGTATPVVRDSKTDNEGDDDAAVGSETGDDDEDDGSTKQPVQVEEKLYDLKGREIKVMIMQETLIPREEPGNEGGTTLYNLVKETERKFNCKFIYEMGTASVYYQQVINSTLAGVYYCDMFRGTQSAITPAFEIQGVILPINDYINCDTDAWKQRPLIKGIKNPNKVYGISRITPINGNGVFYNLDMLSREGIPDLHEYADKGNWTYDTLVDVALRLTKDFNGDGVIDQYGLGSENLTQYAFTLLRGNLISAIEYDNATGKYYYNLTNPKALRPLQLFSELFNTYKVSSTTVINLKSFRDGKAAMYLYNASAGIGHIKAGFTNFGFVVLPAGPDNPGNDYMQSMTGNFYFFPTTIPNPEETLAACVYANMVWDESKPYHITDDDVYTTEVKRMFYRDIDYTRYVEYLKTHRLYNDYVDCFGTSRTVISNEVLTPVAKYGMPITTPVESISGKVNGFISDIMGY